MQALVERMISRSGFKYFIAALAVAGLVGLGAPSAFAMGSDNPTPSQGGKSKSSHSKAESKKHDTKKSAKAKRSDNAPAAEEPWRPDYRRAVALIDQGKYKEAQDILNGLAHTGHADVLNYIGYSSRKLGDNERAETFYKAALKANPNHVGVYEYYGELKVIQGNIDGARAYLAKVQQLCGGTNCEEYQELKENIEKAGYKAD